MTRSVLVAFVVGLVCGIVLWPVALLKAPGAWQVAQRGVCELVDGGRWVSNPGACIQRDCYLDDTCGTRSRLSPRICDLVSVGDPVADAVFWLGEPVSIVGNDHVWRWGKDVEGGPSATVENGLVSVFTCNPPEGLNVTQDDNDGALFGNFKLPFSDKRGNIMD